MKQYLRKVDSEIKIDSGELCLEGLDQTILLVLLITSSSHNEVTTLSKGELVKLIERLSLNINLAAAEGCSRHKGNGKEARRKESLETHGEIKKKMEQRDFGTEWDAFWTSLAQLLYSPPVQESILLVPAKHVRHASDRIKRSISAYRL